MKREHPLIICLVTIASLCIAPVVDAKKSTQYYKIRAQQLITAAINSGPEKGYTKLTITNPENGATGAAAEVAKTDPAAATSIMVDVGEALITLGNQSTRIKAPGYPLKGNLYYMAEQALWKALYYNAMVANTDPLAASNEAIRIGMIFANSAPSDDKRFRDAFRAKARLIINTGNSRGANAHARKIKDKDMRSLQIKKINLQAKSLK